MTKQELAKNIYDVAHLTGKFTLRSGIVSHEYFDKYRFEARPQILKEIAKQLAPMIPKGTEALAGLEMGGIPIATALSLETGLPVAFIRKEAKDYGTCNFAEGYDLKDKQVCIIEDVISTGGAVLDSIDNLRSIGANIEHVLCVIFRGETDTSKLKKTGLNVKYLFHKSDF